MQVPKNKWPGEHLLVFGFCLAVISGPALAILFEYDLTRFPDCTTYLGLARFDFNQSPVRAYRVIIPFAAAAINYLFGGIFAKLAPAYFAGDFSLPFSFFLINNILIAFYGLLIYRYCRVFGSDRFSAIMGTLVMLTCRYTLYTAALPLVDSLFCVVTMLTLLGIKLKNTKMLLWAIFLGPFVKESFIFIAPLILFFSHLNKKRAFLYFLCSAVLVGTYRYVMGRFVFHNLAGGLMADLYHLPNLVRFIPKLFSLYTLNKILMNTGLWILVPLLVTFIKRGWARELFVSIDGYLSWYMGAVLVQMLLSGSMERMFYLAMPLICIIVALSITELRKLYLPSTG